MVNGSRRILRRQAKGIRTIGKATRRSGRKLRKKTARSTRRILTGRR